MRISDFSFDLPENLIAQHPAKHRSDSRLLCLNSSSGKIQHSKFSEILECLNSGDLLIFNDTKVIPARFFGEKETGGKVELLLERLLSDNRLLMQVKASKPLRLGMRLRIYRKNTEIIEDSLDAQVVERYGPFYILQFDTSLKLKEQLFVNGYVPLPPYIKRQNDSQDMDRYQTVYAENDGAVAAPTAGLHFDETLLADLNRKGIDTDFLTLHVGAGTFQPIRVDNVEEHSMHTERFIISERVCEKVHKCKKAGGRVVAVGTTSVRALESAANKGKLSSSDSETDIFIYPGFNFQIVDALITNFHLPESSLLMLVSAFSSRNMILDAYNEAIRNKYRFFSYGDAMFIY